MEPSSSRRTRPSRSEHPDASSITLDAVVTAVVALFVAGIAGVFIYGKHSDAVRQAAAPLPPPAIYHKVETTGSGGQ